MKIFAITASLLTLGLSSLMAQQTINFGSEVGTGTTSTGAAWTANSFSFQLGAFTASFVPTSTNVADWAANWTQLATTTWLDDGGDLYYIGSGAVTAYSAPFTSGAKLYVWGYDTKVGQTAEWILITAPSWTVAADISNPISTDLYTSNAGVTTVVGSVSGNGTTLQSSQVTLTAIPEPSSFAAIAGLGMLGFAAIRKRRSA